MGDNGHFLPIESIAQDSILPRKLQICATFHRNTGCLLVRAMGARRGSLIFATNFDRFYLQIMG